MLFYCAYLHIAQVSKTALTKVEEDFCLAKYFTNIFSILLLFIAIINYTKYNVN